MTYYYECYCGLTEDSTSGNDFDECPDIENHCEKHDRDYRGRCSDCEKELGAVQ